MRRITGRQGGAVAVACIALVAASPAAAAIITVQAEPSEGGTVSGGGFFLSGSSCTVIATPAAGYEFVAWVDVMAAEVASTDASYTFTVTGDRILIAGFLETGTVAIGAVPSPPEGGTTTGSDIYALGASCTVTATPEAGYVFVDWTEDGTFVSGNASYTFTVTETLVLTANFALAYDVATSSDPVAGGTTSGAGTYAEGSSCTVVASPATGYEFVEWTESAATVSTNESYTFTVSSDVSLVAHFALRQYAITTDVAPALSGTTSGDGTYQHGDSCTVVATPAADHGFVNWTEGAVPVSGDASYTFTATADRDLVANFARLWTISPTAGPNGTISPSSDVDVLEGDDQTFTFAPDSGYAVQEVTVDETPVALCLSWTFQDVAADHAIEVTFDVDSDGDGLTDALEVVYGTDDAEIDSDSDGHTDGDEVMAGTDPMDPDDPPLYVAGACTPGASGGAGLALFAVTLLLWIWNRRTSA